MRSGFQEVQDRSLTASAGVAAASRDTTLQVGVHDRRVEVTLAADRRRIAEAGRNLADGGGELALGLCLRLEPAQPGQLAGRQDGARPGPEVLGGELAPSRLPQVLVHVGGLDGAGLILIVEVAEQLLARQVLAALHDPRQGPVAHVDVMLLAALAPEAEAHPFALDPDVVLPQGGQPEAPVLLRVLGVADADVARVEQPHDRGDHLLARHALARQVAANPLAKPRQGSAEVGQPFVLGLVSELAPAWVVAVLLTPPCVPTAGLEVAAGVRADPDVGPGRRDRQGSDSFQPSPADRFAVGPEVDESAPGALPTDAGLSVAHVTQPGGPGSFAGVVEVAVRGAL